MFQEEIPRISPNELTDLVPIGEGGFGVAYRAIHPRFGSVVYKKLNAVVLGERYLASFFSALMKSNFEVSTSAAFCSIIDNYRRTQGWCFSNHTRMSLKCIVSS